MSLFCLKLGHNELHSHCCRPSIRDNLYRQTSVQWNFLSFWLSNGKCNVQKRVRNLNPHSADLTRQIKEISEKITQCRMLSRMQYAKRHLNLNSFWIANSPSFARFYFS